MVARVGVAGDGLAPHLLPQIPEVVEVEPRYAGIVGTGLVDDRYLEPLAIGLRRTRHVHMHAVGPAVPVGVELGLDPEFVADPGGGVGEPGHHLGLSVLDDVGGLGGGGGGWRG